MKKKKIAILGYGNTGKFLCDKIINDAVVSQQFELAFVWNRTPQKIEESNLPTEYQLTGDLEVLLQHPDIDQVDLFVEVAHPGIIHQHGKTLLSKGNLFIASVTALANRQTETDLIKVLNSTTNQHSIFIPVGAAWGIQDVQKMANIGSIEALAITMQFNVDALKLNEPLSNVLKAYQNETNNKTPQILYEGSIRNLAPLAPNNVNTITCLALAAHTIGLDKTQARLIAQKESDAHIVTIEVQGKNGFRVKTERHNPAKKGAVTGDETYNAFLASLLNANAMQKGIHFC